MTTNNWARYMRASAGTELDIAIAKAVNVSPSTVGRWRSGDIDPKPRQVVAFARAYGRNPLEALVAAGYLGEEDLEGASTVSMPVDLDGFSTVTLLEEVRGRIELIGDYFGWIRSISAGVGSPATLGEEALRYADPNLAPRDAEGRKLVEPLGSFVEEIVGADGASSFRLAADYSGADNVTELRPRVGGTTEDLQEVASESILEDPDDTDDKYDA